MRTLRRKYHAPGRGIFLVNQFREAKLMWWIVLVGWALGFCSSVDAATSSQTVQVRVIIPERPRPTNPTSSPEPTALEDLVPPPSHFRQRTKTILDGQTPTVLITDLEPL